MLNYVDVHNWAKPAKRTNLHEKDDYSYLRRPTRPLINSRRENASRFSETRRSWPQVLSYHVMPGKILVTDVKPGPARTLHGGMVTLKSDNGMVSVNETRVSLSDLEADNGVIHVIDTVVMSKQ